MQTTRGEAPPFRHTPLKASAAEIRLFRIEQTDGDILHLVLENYPVPSENAYATLSYRWGTEPASKLVKINGQNFYIRPNLHNFLQYAYESRFLPDFATRDLFWIDAICINQEDVAERNGQVKLMGQIFASSTTTLVWLESEPAERARQDEPPGRRGARFDPFARLLMGNAYWSRLWPCQEIILARDLSIVFDRRRIPYEEFKEKQSYQGNVRDLFLWRYYYAGKASAPYLCQALDAFGRRQCSDLKDRLFAILSLITCGESFPIDYTDNAGTIFWKALHHFAGKYGDTPNDDSVRAGMALKTAIALQSIPVAFSTLTHRWYPVRLNRLENDPPRYFKHCVETRLCFCRECDQVQSLIPMMEQHGSRMSGHLICTAPSMESRLLFFRKGDEGSAHLVAIGFVSYSVGGGKNLVAIIAAHRYVTISAAVHSIMDISGRREERSGLYDEMSTRGSYVVTIGAEVLHLLPACAMPARDRGLFERHLGENWRQYLLKSREWRAVKDARLR